MMGKQKRSPKTATFFAIILGDWRKRLGGWIRLLSGDIPSPRVLPVYARHCAGGWFSTPLRGSFSSRKARRGRFAFNSVSF